MEGLKIDICIIWTAGDKWKAKRPPRVRSDKLVSAALRHSGMSQWDWANQSARQMPLPELNQSILGAGQRLAIYKEAFLEEIKKLTGLSIPFQWPVEGLRKRKVLCCVPLRIHHFMSPWAALVGADAVMLFASCNYLPSCDVVNGK